MRKQQLIEKLLAIEGNPVVVIEDFGENYEARHIIAAEDTPYNNTEDELVNDNVIIIK